METLTACPHCGGDRLRAEGTKKDYVTGRSFGMQTCMACGLGMVNPRPDPAEIAEYYPSYYSWQEDGGGGFMNRLEKFYRFQSLRYEVGKIKPATGLASGSVLDVGCGSGDRLCVFEEKGYLPQGVELTGSAAAAIASGRWNIIQGTVFTADFPEKSFDAISLYNVLEHLHSPLQALQRCRSWLKDSGILVIQVPNRLSWQAKLFGLRWAAADIPRDLFYFDAGTLGAILSRAGYRLVKVDHGNHPLHPPTLVLSLFPGLDPRLVWAQDKPVVNLLKRAAWAAATLSLGWLTVLEGWFGRGALITVYARPAPVKG